MQLINKYKLEIIVFVSGAIVMILEMAGSRVMAPHLGTSLYVWTGLIGIIMASLSAGYYWGGKLADKGASYKTLSMLLFYAGISVLVTNLFKDTVLYIVQISAVGLAISSVLGGFLLFALPSVLLGMVSPYAVKLKLENLKTSGEIVGSLYAISTAGSIFGTFASGFFLISFFGTTQILYLLAGSLVLLSYFSDTQHLRLIRIGVLILITILAALNLKLSALLSLRGSVDVDTAYNRVLISEIADRYTGKVIRRMLLGDQNASAMFLDSDVMVYPYAYYYNLVEHFKPDIKRSLVIGGAAYSYPKEYLARFPDAKLDVVEIDPGLTALAKKYFRLEEDPRLEIFHEDARTYLNRAQAKYDAVFVDVFNTSHSLPFHLTTKEAVQKISDLLVDDGVVAVNLISAIAGKDGGFLESEYYTYKEIFPHVYIFPVTSSKPDEMQNIVLFAFKNPTTPSFTSTDPQFGRYLGRVWKKEIKSNGIILTDEFSPIEKFYQNFN